MRRRVSFHFKRRMEKEEDGISRGVLLSPTSFFDRSLSLIAYFVSNNIPGRIEAATCPNQDPLKATTGLVPLLGIDVW